MKPGTNETFQDSMRSPAVKEICRLIDAVERACRGEHVVFRATRELCPKRDRDREPGSLPPEDELDLVQVAADDEKNEHLRLIRSPENPLRFDVLDYSKMGVRVGCPTAELVVGSITIEYGCE